MRLAVIACSRLSVNSREPCSRDSDNPRELIVPKAAELAVVLPNFRR